MSPSPAIHIGRLAMGTAKDQANRALDIIVVADNIEPFVVTRAAGNQFDGASIPPEEAVGGQQESSQAHLRW